jgi:hypothetical protein
MVNSILTAVTKQLGTTFGTSYTYYVENVEQGLQKPCFTVDLLVPLQRSRSPILYDRTMPLVIHYFSGSEKDKKKDCYSMAEQIVECLEYLSFQTTKLRGEDISWQIVDDVLQVFVTYKFITERVENEGDAMETLTEQVNHR